jgi:hypothetical protein
MVRSVISSAVIRCVVLSVVFYMVRSVISNAAIWCVVLSVMFLYGA